MAARNDLVKELRRAKQRDTASTVAGLRRPSWTDWALNVVSPDHADAVDAFARAAADVREAQAAAVEGRTGGDVRSALRELRDTIATIVRLANAVLKEHGRSGDTADVTARLSDIAGNDAAVEQLRRGVLGSGDPEDEDLFAGLEPGTATPSSRPPRPAASTASSPPPGDRRSRQRAVTSAQRAHDQAQGRLDQAEKARATAERAVDTARDALLDAERRRDVAEERRQQAADELEAIGDVLTEATAELER